VKEFVNLLAVLDQNPSAEWREVVGSVQLAPEVNPDLEPLPEPEAIVSPVTASEAPPAVASPWLPDEDDDELASFKL
jgi:hypothetical protein